MSRAEGRLQEAAGTESAGAQETRKSRTSSQPHDRNHGPTFGPLLVSSLSLVVAVSVAATLGSAAEGELSPAAPTRFANPLAAPDGGGGGADSSSSASARRSAGSPFVWQPLPLRATFRPLNRQSGEQPGSPAALSLSERSVSGADSPPPPPADRFTSNSEVPFPAPSLFQPATLFDSASTSATAPTTAGTSTSPSTSASASASTTARPAAFEPSGSGDDDDDELPTRQPMTRFRPTRAPTEDEDSSTIGAGPASASRAAPLASSLAAELASLASGNTTSSGGGGGGGGDGRISRECFECICEASTNCNAQSRCQTSDVRHTRCGLFLISYDQWLATGLSRELVSREALARDAAADERAFYECVTGRDCAERLLAVYLQQHQKDCDRDGRVDCYDMAAVHHSGAEQCASESLLESQYWSDFSACLGFGR